MAAAAAADAVLLVVGTSKEWESEGHDRDAMDLPGAQDELVARVLDVAPDAVVVVNAGAPVTMPWADRARAIAQVWFGGQEAGNAVVDVLTGEADPGGRLPTTIPERLEHNPSFGNFPPEDGAIRYGEGLLVGYRWYEARHLPTRFPFGHGLSYTTFSLGAPRLSATTFEPGDSTLVVEVDVTNTGSRPGSEVVQCYVGHPGARLARPPKELKAFAKVALDPGATATVRLELDARSFAYWKPYDPVSAELAARMQTFLTSSRPAAASDDTSGWTIDAGTHQLHVGRSSADIAHVVEVEVARGRVPGAGMGREARDVTEIVRTVDHLEVLVHPDGVARARRGRPGGGGAARRGRGPRRGPRHVRHRQLAVRVRRRADPRHAGRPVGLDRHLPHGRVRRRRAGPSGRLPALDPRAHRRAGPPPHGQLPRRPRPTRRRSAVATPACWPRARSTSAASASVRTATSPSTTRGWPTSTTRST